MILYDNRNWLQIIFTLRGSVWTAIRRPFFCWMALVAVAYSATDLFQTRLGSEGHTILGSTTAFLLIFRADQAYDRYWQGRSCVSMFFDDLRTFVMLSLMHVRGGGTSTSMRQSQLYLEKNKAEERGRALRVNLVRLTVAFAVVLKLHTRIGLEGYCFGSISKETKWHIDWDRFRLSQLLKAHEFETVDGHLGIVSPEPEETPPNTPKATEVLAAQFREGEAPPGEWPDTFAVRTRRAARMHILIVYWLREQMVMNMNEFQNNVPWGIRERFIPVLSKLLNSAQTNFEKVNDIMTTPLPLPYACLCKTLLTMFLAAFPFEVDFHIGYFGGIIVPILIGLALLGIDAVATELENPFGDDVNDLELLEMIHTLESECMEMLMLCGDNAARSCFVWRRMPEFTTASCFFPLHQHLVVADFCTGEIGVSEASGSARGSKRSSKSSLRSALPSQSAPGSHRSSPGSHRSAPASHRSMPGSARSRKSDNL